MENRSQTKNNPLDKSQQQQNTHKNEVQHKQT